MQLSELLKTINIIKTYNYSENANFSSITSNSKLTNKNTIFIYDKNSGSKYKYIEEAINNKIPAIITNKYFKSIKVTQFLVSNIFIETELLLKKIYKKLPYKTIAVTGTNGKSSVVWYISKILNKSKISNTTVGTLGYYKNGKKCNNIGLTTPAYEELYKYGFSNKTKKSIYIFEASSHALDQNRLRNYPVNVAAVTNITLDHLDYHKTMSNYRKSKMNLFTKHLSKSGYAVINSKIKNLSSLINKLKLNKIKIIFFGNKNIFFVKKKKSLILNIKKNKYLINNLNPLTDIEIENLECAIGCCLALNIKENKIIQGLSAIKNPPGRFQKINFKKNNSTIIIDYAHTPDALRRVLQSFKLNEKKPALLFGCGGERDKSKRKSMGVIAKNYALRTYVTDDNPRNESPSKIRKDILKYCPNAKEIPNRKNAIKCAIKELKKNETLIIAGKGHETVQIIKNKKYKFDDLKLVRDIVSK